MKIPLHIINGHQDKFSHVADDLVVVEDVNFLDKWIDDPIVLVIIFKIDRCTVNRLRLFWKLACCV